MTDLGARIARIGDRPGSTIRLVVAVGLAAVLVGVGAGVGVHQLTSNSSPARGTSLPYSGMTDPQLDGQATWAAGTRPAPPITTLRDQTGRLFSLSSLRGRTVAVVFFDSHCHAECPLEGRALAAAERSLPASQRPVLVAVSVNPKDTPASARAAAREWGLSEAAPFHWLMGTRAELAPVWREYKIYVSPHLINGDIEHTEALYLVDKHGDERSAYLYPFASKFVHADLRMLATGKRA